MAYDQNSVPMDLRPLNMAAAVAEEPLISPATVTPPTPNSVGEIFYTPSATAGAAATWCVRPIAHPNVSPAAFGFNYGGSGYGNRVVAGNALNMGKVLGSSGRKVKFLCSFGGKILPRPSDGMLRYVGGQTRIISVRRDVSFNDLVQKMVDTYGQALVIKYQLPEEDLDALVSVSCPDDVENMMEEYEKLVERSSDGSAKLRVFLFSASDSECSSGVQFGDLQDTGQKYFDAVNGIGVTEGVGGGINRKESVTSAASTQNSDMSGGEALDGSITGQGDVSGVSLSSSKENVSAASSNTSSNLVVSEAGASVYLGNSAATLAMPVAKNSPTTHNPYFQNELEKSVPVTLSQQPFGLQQSGTEIPVTSPYLQPFVDPGQEVMNHADYVQLPSQMGFTNTQILGKTGTVFTPQQFHDNTPGLAFHPVIPGVQMTMTQPSSHGIRPNVIQQPQPQPLVQPQQHLLDQYNDENTSGVRIIQVPAERSYNTYQVQANQVPSVIVGGNYGWVQVPPQERVVISDGLLSQQQVMIPEKIRRAEDCTMCQRKLPHAHSDPVVPDQHNNGACPSPGSSPSHRSFPMEDNIKAQAANKIMPMKEGIAEQVENWVKQNVLLNKPVSNDTPIVDGTSIQTSECMVQGSQKEYTNELTGVGSKSDAIDNWIRQDHLKTIDGRMDTFNIRNSEVYVSNDYSFLPVDKSSGNDKLHYNSQQSVEEEVILDNNFGRSKLIVDANQSKMTGMMPCSMEISYGHNSRSGECNEAAQPPVWGIPGSNCPPKIGNPHRDDLVSSSSPSVRFGEVQDTPNSLFSNQDPWNIQHGTFFPPAGPNKDALKNRNDHFVLNYVTLFLIDGHEANTIFCFGFLIEGSAEDIEDQQLQAVAEDVAASVLHSRTPSNSDLHSRDVSCQENIEDGSVQNNLIDVTCGHKTQDAKNKQPEKANFGFPASGVGKLQVIKNCDLEELTELGSGTFGTVYHGKWRGTDVAIKRITDRCFAGKPSEQERMRSDFWNEAIKLADLHHPNVVAFYGVVLDGPGGSVATVTEYMVNGSLRNSLQKSERNLDKRKRLLIAMDVAFGMEYLHGRNIVHFDLKSDNLLVNLRDPHRPICKVGDLGLSKVKCQTLISGGVRGTLPWMAPELLNGSSSLVSEKVDVFSFGIVMWELYTGEEPYADLHYGAIIGGIVSNTLRPPVPESCDPEWRLLMERCWSSEPSERPTFTEIASELRSIASKISPRGQNSPKGQNQQLQPNSLQTQVHK
uniref:Serine/threonine-protein kinase CTR1 n=1 Tax=Cajanus cajan TaxID=3821 RepID=A0A151R0J9_CAJCA|nr:Serine/threonine-protein kinase CTR1 [Cajanus cajan]